MSVRVREGIGAARHASTSRPSGPLGRLSKLRGRSLDELAERCRQELAKLGERVLGGAGRELSDEAFVQNLIDMFLGAFTSPLTTSAGDARAPAPAAGSRQRSTRSPRRRATR